MRKIGPGVHLESKFHGIHIGLVASGGETLLIDSPVRLEDGRTWLDQARALGRPRFLVLLDHHPDRALGARGFGLPLVAHDVSREQMGAWQDTFRGDAHPMGAEADRLKRATGVRKALPDLTFSDSMRLHVGELEVELWHRPGPSAGAIWAVVPSARVVFVGDCVWVREPPYLGECDIPAWLHSLEQLRERRLRGFRIVSSRNGVVQTVAVHSMIRVLRKLRGRLRRLKAGRELSQEAAAALAQELARSFRMPASRKASGLLRLQSGLMDFQRRNHPGGK
ncbi:MAG TPA: MBL fold metallo-hydrolase [Anaerolineales bacterium]